MKKNDKRYIIIISILLFIAFLFISIFTFYKSNETIRDEFLESEGNASANFAVLVSENLSISDSRIKEIKEMSYEELLNCPENKKLKDLVDSSSYTHKIDYAYIMVHLNDDEVKYKVDKNNKEEYDAKIGTPLDIMWLLDVNVSSEAQINQDSNSLDSYEETNRYSYYIPEDDEIFSPKPNYVLNQSEWGDHICGYAPFYSSEGTFIGVIGIEFQTNSFNKFADSAILSMGTLFLVTTISLIILFIFLYSRYRKLQYDQIYNDALTKIRNRSFYNNRFIKKLKSEKHGRKYFALFICDIDYFKKVNDTFGHEVGDQVLIDIATLLSNHFEEDNLVRFGGEEFVVGMWVKDPEVMKQKIEDLYKDLHSRKYSNQMIDITLSLGCVISKVDTVSGWHLSESLKQADNELYYIKEHGRNAYTIKEFVSKK